MSKIEAARNGFQLEKGCASLEQWQKVLPRLFSGKVPHFRKSSLFSRMNESDVHVQRRVLVRI